MEIIYYKNFDKKCFYNEAEFNLHSDFIVESHQNGKVKDGTINVSLNIKEQTEKSPYENLTSITSSKIIVGENGVGKSTIIEDIINILGQRSSYYKHFIILSKRFIFCGEKIVLCEKTKSALKDVFKNIEVQNYSELYKRRTSIFEKLEHDNYKIINFSNSLNPVGLSAFYGEPVASSAKFENGNSYIDVSLQNSIILSNTFGLQSELKYIFKDNQLSTIDNHLTHRFFSCYAEFDWFSNLIPESILSKLKVKVSIPSLNHRFLDYLDKIKIPSEFNQNLEYDSSSGCDILTHQLLLSLILNRIDLSYWYDNSQRLNDIIQTKISEIFTHEVIHINNESILKVIRNSIERGTYQNIIELKEIINNKIPKNDLSVDGNYVLDFNQNKEFLFRVSETNVELLSKKAENEKFSFNLIKLELSNLSSGERNFLYTISNVIDRLGAIEKTRSEVSEKPNDSLYYTMFLDEPANEFHPNWQREYMDNLYKFLEEYNKTFNKTFFQIIVTSHSPFFLSDFSKNDVIRLRREESEDDRFKTTIENSGSVTFGANIYDLFKDSFFMDKGFIGEFAKQKIEELFDELIDLRDTQEEITYPEYVKLRQRVEMIGDRIIRTRLEDILYEIKYQKSENELKAEELEKQARELRNKLN